VKSVIKQAKIAAFIMTHNWDVVRQDPLELSCWRGW